MVPKWSQNLSKIDPGGGLEATWEPPLKQGASKTLFWRFWLHFGTPFGTSLGSFWASFFWLFFWDSFLMALASIWAPKTPPKWDPRGGQNQNMKINDFVFIYYTLATFRGAENGIFSMLFLNTVLEWLLEPILVILAHFWGPFWKPFWSLLGYHFCIDF